MNDLSDKLRAALAAHPPRKKYLIGVSGGRDSMALLHALHGLGYKKLVVCHLNHGLRREASLDAAFVRQAARRLGLACETSRADTRRLAAREHQSLELAARELRLAFFSSCARKHRCRRLFLAHHADDQIETILFNYFRGAGPAGLAGMKPTAQMRGLEILRPLLDVRREEINAFVRAGKIRFREDASNARGVHTRNRLRRDVIPAIQKAVGTAFGDAVLRTAEILREENAWMEALVPPVPERLSCRELRSLPVALQRRMVLRWLNNGGVPEAGFQETLRTLSLAHDVQGPAKINLPGNFHARRRAGELFLERPL